MGHRWMNAKVPRMRHTFPGLITALVASWALIACSKQEPAPPAAMPASNERAEPAPGAARIALPVPDGLPREPIKGLIRPRQTWP
jgi:hypothetical protein